MQSCDIAFQIATNLILEISIQVNCSRSTGAGKSLKRLDCERLCLGRLGRERLGRERLGLERLGRGRLGRKGRL